MKVCLDTNALLQALDAGHLFNALLRAWMAGRFVWAVSTPILLEYEEVITRMGGNARWIKFLRFLELAQASGGSMEFVTNWFQFHVISADPDDNIFTDCAISSDADYVVTEDRHFAPLADADFRPKPIKPQMFMQQYLGS